MGKDRKYEGEKRSTKLIKAHKQRRAMQQKEFKEILEKNLGESIGVLQMIIQNHELREEIIRAATAMLNAVKNKGIIFTCGNGGSFDDADHTAGELIGWYADKTRQRSALAVVPLGGSVGALTAIANDIGYEYTFSRQLEGFTKTGVANNTSVLLAFSTSGNSPNVLRAVTAAKTGSITVIAMTGGNGGKLAQEAEIVIKVPSDVTARIQEAHHVIYHTLCEIIEKEGLGP